MITLMTLSTISFRTVSVDIYHDYEELDDDWHYSFRTVSVDIYLEREKMKELKRQRFRTVSVDIYH